MRGDFIFGLMVVALARSCRAPVRRACPPDSGEAAAAVRWLHVAFADRRYTEAAPG